MRPRVSLLINALLILTFCVPINGQRPRARQSARAAQPCTLTLQNAPTIRGVRLGMPLDEFRQVFPAARERPNSRPEVGATKPLG